MKFVPEIFCCYCSTNIATTRDHVPPKGIFNRPRPSDLITVPCCSQCNNGASILDEKFRVYLGMHVARFNYDGEQLFKTGALKTLLHNSKLKLEVLKNIDGKPIQYRKDGILKNGSQLLWDSKAHDSVIHRITCGLYYHHFRKPIDPNSKINVYWFNDFKDILSQFSFTEVSIGNGIFKYYYARQLVKNEQDISCWLYQFYSGHFAGAFVF